MRTKICFYSKNYHKTGTGTGTKNTGTGTKFTENWLPYLSK
jgi:hypothetical protein